MVIKAILAKGFNADTAIPHPFDSKLVHIGNVELDGAPKLNSDVWIREQKEDVDIGPVVELVKKWHHLQYTCKEGD